MEMKSFSEEELADMIKKQLTSLPDDLENELVVRRKRPIGEIVLTNQRLPASNEEDSITNEEIPIKNEEPVTAVPITSLVNWFGKYRETVPVHIKTVNFRVAGVNLDSYLFITIPHPNNGFIENGEPRREIIMFKDANRIPAIDLPISDISVYHSGFKMIHPFKNGYFKSYGGKSNNLIVSIASSNLIPYHILRIKNSNAIIFKENSKNYENVLNDEAQREIIKTLYPVITKSDNWLSMKKNIDICNHFLDLQKDIKDNAHHIKLDNIMIGILTGKFPTMKERTTRVGYQLQL